jgi:hypothetical protein
VRGSLSPPACLISPLRIEGTTVSMRHRPAAAVPIDEPFVARRLAMAEGVLSQTLERLDDGSVSRASAAYATLEVERAAARVRYWRELQRREASHPSVRACKLLGHSWVATSAESTSPGVCRRCGAQQVRQFR